MAKEEGCNRQESIERNPVPALPADNCVSRKSRPRLNLSSPLHNARGLGQRICKLKSLYAILLFLITL